MLEYKPVTAFPKSVPFELMRFSLLERLQQDFPIAVLLAPAGYGKTTLLAQFALSQQNKRQHKMLWLTLHEDDAEPAHLGERLKRQLQRSGFCIKSAKNSDLARSLNDSDTAMTILIDVCEHLSDLSGKWLDAFISQLAEGHKVVLAGRVLPKTFPLVRYSAAGKVLLLELNDLRFSDQEVKQYLALRQADGNSEGRKLEGWPAGLALSVSVGLGKESARFEASDLLLELMAQLPQALQEISPQMAVLDTWGEKEAQALNIVLPKDWLKVLQHGGLPLAMLSNQRCRPHQLLLDTLETLLEQTPQHQRLRRAVAQKLLKDNRPLEATRHLLKAKDLQAALDIALDLGKQFWEKQHFVLLARLWEMFSFDDLPGTAKVQLAWAWCQTKEWEKGLAVLETLVVQKASLEQSVWVEACKTLGRAYLMRFREEEARILWRDIYELGDYELGDYKQGDTRSKWNLDILIASSYVNDNPQKGEEILLETLKGYSPEIPVQRYAVLLETLSTLQYYVGKTRESLESMFKSVRVCEEAGLPLTFIQLLNVVNAYLRQHDLTKAQHYQDKAFIMAQEEGHAALPLLYEKQGEIYLANHQYELALESAQQGIESGAHYAGLLTQRQYLLKMDALLCLGRTVEAETVLRDLGVAPTLIPDVATSLPFYQGRIHFAKGEMAKAHAAFSSSLSAEPLDALPSEMYLAELARQHGTLTEAQVTKMMNGVAMSGSDALLYFHKPVLELLYRYCFEKNWFRERFELALNIKRNTYKLELTTLGKPAVFLNDQPMNIKLSKAVQLLVYLALHGASSKETLLTALWQGKNDEATNSYFRVAVKQLRSGLSSAVSERFNPLPFEAGLYALHPALEIKLDTYACREALGGSLAEQEQAFEKSQKEFLQGWYDDWIEELRHALNKDAMRVGTKLAQGLESTNPKRALSIYQSLAKRDPTYDIQDATSRLLKRL